MKMADTEYSHINEIGGSFLDWSTPTEKVMSTYYHKSEIRIVEKILQRYNFKSIVDLGCGEGAWYYFYKKMGFNKIIGIDISEKRLQVAKKGGFDETYCCNGYNMPFENNSIDCIISNNVLVHVLQDEDKIKIFKEIRRVLSKGGIYLFNFPPAKAYGYFKDTTNKYCRMINVESMKRLVQASGLFINGIEPCYFIFPRIGAHPRLAKFSTKCVFTITDIILGKLSNINNSKVVYVIVSKLD